MQPDPGGSGHKQNYALAFAVHEMKIDGIAANCGTSAQGNCNNHLPSCHISRVMSGTFMKVRNGSCRSRINRTTESINIHGNGRPIGLSRMCRVPNINSC